MKFATRQSRNGVIAEGATIVTFTDQAAAEAWLLAGHSAGLYPRISAGRFDGHWRRTDTPGLIEAEPACAPFNLTQIDTKAPGEHAGNFFCHTPTAEILVLIDEPPGD